MSGVLHLPVSLCRVPVWHYYRASQWNRCTNDDEEEGLGPYLGDLFIRSPQASQSGVWRLSSYERISDGYGKEHREQAWRQDHVRCQNLGAFPVFHRQRAQTGPWPWILFESRWLTLCLQHKGILQRPLPDALKMSIARRIENNLFSKVMVRFCLAIHVMRASDRQLPLRVPNFHDGQNIS